MKDARLLALVEEHVGGVAVVALIGDEELIQLLLARGADRALRNSEGKRPRDVARDERIRSLLA